MPFWRSSKVGASPEGCARTEEQAKEKAETAVRNFIMREKTKVLSINEGRMSDCENDATNVLKNRHAWQGVVRKGRA